MGDKDQSCFDRHLLEFVEGGTRVDIGREVGIYNYNLILPRGVTCDQCILQWHYNTGNSYGTSPETGEQCLGCGAQETFRGCSDIRITGRTNSTTAGPTTEDA